MRARMRLVMWGGVAALLAVMPSAWAFYPSGAFRQDQELVIPRWPLSYMDTNHDGDVRGDNEGVPITFETGSLGFSSAEEAILRSVFKTWADVPTAYAAFRYTDSVPNLPDRLETSADVGAMDGYNYVALQVLDESQDLPSGVIGVTFITSAVEATQIYIDGTAYEVLGGQILDADIVLDGVILHKTNLAGAAMFNVGALLGLAQTPMFDLWPMTVRDGGNPYPILPQYPDEHAISVVNFETPALEMRDPSGQLKWFGVTPSMFPYQYYYSPGPVDSYTSSGYADYEFRAPSKSATEQEADLYPLPKTTSLSYLAKVNSLQIFKDFAGKNAALLNRKTVGPKLIVGESFPVDLSTSKMLWDFFVDGPYRVYTVAIQSADAQALRLQVDLATLRPEEQLWQIDPTVGRSYGPYTQDLSDRHDLWLPAVSGDKAVLTIRTIGTQMPSLTILQGSHFFRPLSEVFKELGCHINIACETDPDLQEISTGIGLVLGTTSEGWSYVASGSLLNNPDTAAFEPYFLTANHVISDAEEARAAEVIWDYRVSTCTGGTPPSWNTLPYSSGTELLATLQPLDGALVQLDAVPVGALGRAYLGWDLRVPSTEENLNLVVGISHPGGSHMRISRAKISSITNELLVDGFGPVVGMIGVDFTEGIVEPGSSGSPLMSDDGLYHVLGMLSNGPGDQDCETSPPVANYASFRDFFPFMAGYLTGTTPPPVVDRAGQEGAVDLAPDDIAGISFLYPRQAENIFFEVKQEARTHNQAPLPSVPISGGLITAWCDADNNTSTSRVPLVSTMTSLYETQASTRGRFDIRGLYKQLESSATGLFDATYTFTVQPFYYYPAHRITLDPPSFDSTHGGVSGYSGLPGLGFTSGYPSEVFNEHGNLLDGFRYEEGTPLKYDRIRRKVISADTERTLDSILPRTTPMFGDAVSTCPMGVASIGLSSSKGPDALRVLRDRYLLHTALGTAAVDAYYHAAPSLANYLLTHETLWKAAHAAAATVEWSFAHSRLVAAALVLTVLVGMGGIRIMRRRSLRRTATFIALLGLAGAFSSPAQAQLQYLSTEQMVAISNDILTGEVVSADSHWNEKKQIVTDVVIRVDDVVKGVTNKGGNVSLQVPGGEVGPIRTSVTFLPGFAPGERVLLFLENRRKTAKNADAGPLVVSGTRGKYEIKVDEQTQTEYISGATVEAAIGLKDAAKALGQAPKDVDATATAQPEPIRVKLDDYKQYLRDIVKKQKSAQK